MHYEAEEYLKKKDKKLGSIIKTVGSCGLDHNNRSKFDVLASSIISQQLSVKAARTIKGRILNNINETNVLNATSISKTNVDDLRQAGLSKAKANYIISLAINTVSGNLDLNSLEQSSDKEVVRLLTEQKGIGLWTAEMFLIFGLGRKDVLSTSDAGLLRSAQMLFKLHTRPTPEEFTVIAEKWRPYRSIASWYLWRALD